MNHLETLIAEYLEWQGFLIRRNVKVGRRERGGWEMELDVIGVHPQENRLVHYEASLDAHSWAKREERFQKKFEAGRNYIFSDIFPWLSSEKNLEQVAVLISHPQGRDELAGARLISVDELMAEIRESVLQWGLVSRNAIPEQYPLLRTVQLSHCGYYRVVSDVE